MNLTRYLYISSVYAYSFCKKCKHSDYDPTNRKEDEARCTLFKYHLLFKDRPDVDFLGKEICTERGKYFKEKNHKTESKDESPLDRLQRKDMPFE